MKLDDLTRILEIASQNPILAIILLAALIGIAVAGHYVAGYFSESGKLRTRSPDTRSSDECQVPDASSQSKSNRSSQERSSLPGLQLTFLDGVRAQARMHVRYRVKDFIKLLETAGSTENAWKLLIPIAGSRAYRLIETVPYEEARTRWGEFELRIQQELIQEFEHFGLALAGIVLGPLSVVYLAERSS